VAPKFFLRGEVTEESATTSHLRHEGKFGSIRSLWADVLLGFVIDTNLELGNLASRFGDYHHDAA
jgi:hypothetical protein